MADVIREFLISLSYKIDSTAQRKYNESIRESETGFGKLGKASIAASAIVAASLFKITSSLDKMYFASQRTGASVENLNAFAFAAGRIGSSADAANASIEAMASKFRRLPGMRQLLGQLGVTATGDPTDIAIAAKKALAHTPMYVQLQYADLLGIEERLWLGLDKLSKLRDQYKRDARAIGTDYDGAAIRANHLWDGLTRIYNVLMAIAVAGGDSFMKKIGFFSLDAFANKLIKNADLIQHTMQILFNAILGMVALFSIRLMASPFGIMLASITALMLVLDDYMGYTQGKTAAIPWEKIEKGGNWAMDKIQQAGDYLYGGAGIKSKDITDKESKDNAAEVYRTMKSLHYTDEAIAGTLGNIQAESSFNPKANQGNGAHLGLLQWDKGRQALYSSMHNGQSIDQASVADQIKFMYYEQYEGRDPLQRKAGADLLMNQNSVGGSASSVNEKYLRSGQYSHLRMAGAQYWMEQITKPGYGAVGPQVVNNNTFNLHGNPEANATAIDNHLEKSARRLNQNAKSSTQ